MSQTTVEIRATEIQSVDSGDWGYADAKANQTRITLRNKNGSMCITIVGTPEELEVVREQLASLEIR